ncbi:serine hydrolase [Formosa sp. PL04]|uniref:serine hydrolase n=1 Tax=Formosa sp. PL04 TaxID=3081755 RepID=UPI002981DB7F|nr:serine hydrolase [Formosa sp. PL04]MDW5289248.1 serine hydrolase [Formosa sp. PL04]
MKKIILLVVVLASFGFSANHFYPIDGYALTGIKRLAYLERVKNGEIKSDRLPPGAFYPLDSIRLNLVDRKNELGNDLEVNEALQSRIEGLFRGLDKNYSITVLDMTKGQPIRFAQYREAVGYQPGSVGKLVVLAAFFNQLCQILPGSSFEARQQLLKDKVVTAGTWALHDHHTVPIYNLETQKLVKRTVRATDEFTLYEWLDNMVSVSNNGAASVVWREALLMHVFQGAYPSLTFEEGEAYFKNTPKSELSKMAINVVNEPLRELGITEDEWRLGKFFTEGAGQYIPGRDGSIGTPIGLMKFMVALEKGEIVDENSSLEMKRLLYMTDRRIRYAASKKLDSSAVYFKSGSLYSCAKDKGDCGKYMGNVYNYMNSVAIVEKPNGTRYAVCLMSNVLQKNSANDHLMLASKIDEIMDSKDHN